MKLKNYKYQDSTKMLTWLGKQYLGQKDSPEDREGTAPLPWED